MLPESIRGVVLAAGYTGLKRFQACPIAWCIWRHLRRCQHARKSRKMDIVELVRNATLAPTVELLLGSAGRRVGCKVLDKLKVWDNFA